LELDEEELAQTEKNDSPPSDDRRTCLLELADTLCNIGGLCLEWIRRQGPNARHVVDAESAFSRALQVRILFGYYDIVKEARRLVCVCVCVCVCVLPTIYSLPLSMTDLFPFPFQFQFQPTNDRYEPRSWSQMIR
jgi:hypothetical protein